MIEDVCEQPQEQAAVHAVHAVTCRLPIMLKSGGAIPKAAQSRASSDTLLLAEAAPWLEWEAGASPWGAFMFAAAGTEGGRKTETETSEVCCSRVDVLLAAEPVERSHRHLRTQFLGRPPSLLLLVTAGRTVGFLLRGGTSCPCAVDLQHLLQHQGPLLQHTAGVTQLLIHSHWLFFVSELSEFSHHGKGLRGKWAIWLIIGYLYSRCWWGRGLVSGNLETGDQVFKFGRGLNVSNGATHEFSLINRLETKQLTVFNKITAIFLKFRKVQFLGVFVKSINDHVLLSHEVQNILCFSLSVSVSSFVQS